MKPHDCVSEALRRAMPCVALRRGGRRCVAAVRYGVADCVS